MDLVFCGTPRFAVPALEALVREGFRVRLVVTQPDRPSGRGQQPAAPPVKQAAQALGLPVIQPEKIKNDDEFRRRLTQVAPRAIVVIGYGRIIPKWMLDLPPLGNINLHASLLPKYRGAAPIQWAIASGDTVTGNTTMRIDDGLDTGPILMQEELMIEAGDTAVTLAPKLAERGAKLVVYTLRALEQGKIAPIPQDNGKATLAPILKKEDGLIDFGRSAQELVNRLRGFQPWPGAYTSFRGKNLIVHAARGAAGSLDSGELQTAGDTLLAGAGGGSALEILELQLEGKKRMPARDFIHGYKPQPGEKLGE